MPFGTNAEKLRTVPEGQYVIDAGQFFAGTSKNVTTPINFSDPGDQGGWETKSLPKAGILSRKLIHFVGQIEVTPNTGAVTTLDEWPYGLLDEYMLRLNGQTDLFQLGGVDLAVHRYITHPAYEELSDVFPGSIGGGDTLGAGTHDVVLTWEVPVAIDQTTLIGSLLLQSPSTNAMQRVRRAATADLTDVTADATVSITGDWFVQLTTYELPYSAEGQVVIPDLSKFHGMAGWDQPFTGTGTKRVELIRSIGQLGRVIVSARRDRGDRLSAAAGTPEDHKIDRALLTYGANQNPLTYDPAQLLVGQNNTDYGGTVPYDRLALDFLRENASRDAVFMEGLTELAVQLGINQNVAVADGQIRVVQEILF